MQTTIIVRSKQTGLIVSDFQVYSLDEFTVNSAVRTIQRVHGDCEIDMSQVEAARKAMLTGCFAAA